MSSQYVLIADPDTFIISPLFRSMVLERLERHKVAGVMFDDYEHLAYYHPICLAFETRLWKEGTWSFIDDLSREETPNDVGWELTRHLGGIQEGALLPLTRRGLAGHVFADAFTNTWGTSRIHDPGYVDTIDGRSKAATLDYQRRWSDWVDRVAAGLDTVDGFPIS